MSYHARRILTPGASRKRKEKEAFSSPKPSSPITATQTAVNNLNPTSYEVPKPQSSNRLLAGYMAYEFLTKGTLFGQKFDPARAEAKPVSASHNLAEPKRNKAAKSEAEASKKVKPNNQSYAEVATLVMGDGAHIPEIVNPTQLARWIQM